MYVVVVTSAVERNRIVENPILSKLQTLPGAPPSGSDGALDREGFFAESLKLIPKVIAGRRSVLADDAPDISQEAALRLWKWLTKFENKIETSLDETEALGAELDASSAETFVLVKTVWQGICRLSLYQRQALLFSSVDLVLYLFQFGIEENELLAKLELTGESWERISTRMPLTDIEMAKEWQPQARLRRRDLTLARDLRS